MSPRSGADERLRRLLALVPWVATHDGPHIEDVCARFGTTERELLDDLDLLFLVGVHPFDPGSLIEVDVDEGRVWIRFADWFARPLRLTPAEGLSLVASGVALLDAPGTDPDGPLARGLAKLAAVLGVDPDEAVGVELGDADIGVVGVLEAAATEHHPVSLDHYSYGRDTWSRRVIEPHRVFSSAGQWYVQAWCRTAGGGRLFRVDRIRDPSTLAETFSPTDSEPPAALYSPRPSDPRIVLDLDESARWVVEQYPVESVEESDDGRLRVALRWGERPLLERLLVQLGPAARVVEGDATIGPSAARRLLTRYAK